MQGFAYDTMLRYAINTVFSAIAGYFALSPAQVSQGESVVFALASAAIVAGTWAWGIYRSRPSAKAADLVAQVPGTTIVTSPELAASVPNNFVVSNHSNAVVAK